MILRMLGSHVVFWTHFTDVLTVLKTYFGNIWMTLISIAPVVAVATSMGLPFIMSTAPVVIAVSQAWGFSPEFSFLSPPLVGPGTTVRMLALADMGQVGKLTQLDLLGSGFLE